ncbi:prion-like-(Q/N-rich) domain-bearing protein 25 isoform X2 [Harpegnathos saltator]|uniref:prion-like-(Q/N-rich) domain-bearing protein 25 isoform X2 n=1 Tax=Harpegnathos saltator TaxID=610380 RepID=UPI000DBEE28B|nr:prion-like-(Q/N-rich) domain-bearing protein 25 isoform X2 [Harpegnathos saltator]
MRQTRQVVYVLLYLQFFIRDVFTLDVDVLSKEYGSVIDDIAQISKWECESDNECTATGSTCNNRECQCALGNIYNSNMTACVKVATRLHDQCEDTVQCSAYLLGGAECVDNICVCGPGYYYLHGRCNRYVGLSERCERSVDCYVNADFEASTCNENTCECSPGFYRREYRTCRRAGKAVGDECTIDIDCTFENAACKDFVCVKKFESKEAIGPSADVVSTTTAADKSTEIRLGSNCTGDEDCSGLGNAMCDDTGKCRCDRAHFAPHEQCIPELGESCRSDDAAVIERSACRAGVWSCANGTVASEDNRECRKATTEYGGECSRKEDCYILGPDAECADEKCVCNAASHYVRSELFCWGNKGIGEACVQKRDCYVDGFKNRLVCKDGSCGCPDNTHLNKDKTACVGRAAGVGEICEVNEDCAAKNAICNEELCECRENYYLSKDRCLAGLNATCRVDKQCALANSACISEVCSCKSDYVPVATNSCLPVSSYGESCSEDIQCSAKVPGATCATINQGKEKRIADLTDTSDEEEAGNKVCACDKEDHHRYGRCFKKKLLSESCTNIGECYVSFNQQTVMCMNGECTCNWGYVKMNSSVCLKDTRRANFLNAGCTFVSSARVRARARIKSFYAVE